MKNQIKTALISVFNKDGLEPIVRKLNDLGIQIYSTGGTQTFIQDLNIACTAVEDVTGYPSILGGRVKTLHPKVFGGILARRSLADDIKHIEQHDIPLLDLVIVDLYPFEDTVAQTDDEPTIIEKIDIGGVSLIRAAAKNYKDVSIISSRKQYNYLQELLDHQSGEINLEQRRLMAKWAFEECAHYDVAIANYFENENNFQLSTGPKQTMRYGENPHQIGEFYGQINDWFEKLNGKDLSYNNMVDADAACQLMAEFSEPCFAVIKHTNVCGIAQRDDLKSAWEAALAGDPESAFGGVLVCNRKIDLETATSIHQLFFEILIAPDFDNDALELLKTKKNRNLLRLKKSLKPKQEFKRIFDGVLVQSSDDIHAKEWQNVGATESTEQQNADLIFANLVCKHLKSNAIALVKNQQLLGKGCGQTSRIDALKHAIEKAQHFQFDLQGAVMASDAFFPFDDCIKIAHEAGISAVVQPGGSVRDKDSIAFAQVHNMVMLMTGTRHFKH